MLKGNMKDVLYPAAGLEILHNYSLIVDDIIDNSVLRRGKPTAWAKFGKSIAQCIAVDYGVSIFEAGMKSKNHLEINKILAKALKTLIDGEILDILFEQSGKEEEPYVKKNRYFNIREQDFLKMVSQKTAALLSASCEIGGICANASKQEIKHLKKFGLNIGMAFQISDDILDIFGEEKKFGKKIGKDIEERKGGNCVVYFASQEFSAKEKKEFWEILRKKKIKAGDIKKAIGLIRKTKAREMAFEYGERFAKQAKKNLSFLPQNKYNNFLAEIADLIMKRER